MTQAQKKHARLKANAARRRLVLAEAIRETAQENAALRDEMRRQYPDWLRRLFGP